MRLRRSGSVFGADGFTLIELLIVVVIVGILAAIAIPQFASTKEKAFDTAAKSDLRNLMTAQEAYMYDFGEYAPNTSELATEENFNQSDGVSTSVNLDGSGGYEADASHSSSPNCFEIHMGPSGAQDIKLVSNAASGGGTCGG